MTPKLRESLYYVGTIVPAVLGLALVWGGIDQGAANNIGDIIAGLLALLGATAPATAAVKVNQQRRDGTFETLSPADQVVKSVQDVLTNQSNALAEVDKMKQAVAATVSAGIPGFGPLAARVINSVDLSSPLTAYSQNYSSLVHPYDR